MVYQQHPHYIVLRAEKIKNNKQYTLLTIKSYFKNRFRNQLSLQK